jgi:hypothetical protein
MNVVEPSVGVDVGLELRGARFGDARRTRRLVSTAQAFAGRPESSLPKAIASKGSLNAAYSLFGHPSVTEDAILQPHRDETRERCLASGKVLVAHDTTEFVYSTAREGIGHLRTLKDHGFLMHGSLAITADGHRRALGVAAAYFWTRSLEAKVNPKGAKRVRDQVAESEAVRWFRQCVAAEEQLGPGVTCLHVMDREGDSYELFASLCARDSAFIIRNRTNRVARSEDEGPDEHIRTLRERADVVFETLVPVSRRQPKLAQARGKPNIPREARTATVAVKATAVQIRKPPYVTDAPLWIDLNVVDVREIYAPDGTEPVVWTLLTTEPIDSLADITAIIEHYRARWVIEEWFKAIKTGCQVEQLQLETYHSLKNAIAVYLVIAWRMLLLRALARNEPDLPAEVALSPPEIHVLRMMQPDAKLPARASVAQAFVAIAMMGGYIKHAVPPGWLTLARGFEKLILLERGWTAGRRAGCQGS